MIDYTFEFYEEREEGNIAHVSLSVQAKTFEEAKMIVNTQILLSSPRTVFDWFKLEENKYTGVKIYC